ncbi:uncharacterized protein LOC130521352 [Takifugu flavidus]|uniref:uncharacterized protein LOC130521352 n=1 Tax=Takifugu flavidus TaxID=433684 RepID=UPI0025448249|nr:uncharacterized protein LOC130521352 [Takifugu flavidus]
MKQVDELNIDTEETLNAVVELIVNKALSEQSYSATYAKMCHHLKGLMVSSQSSNDFVLFHKRLLTRCQMEFQNCGLLTQKEKDVSVQEDLEQTRHKTRVRLLGTVRFIGELFKLKMIWEPIIHTCIGKLLQDECEDSLECVCKLLSTVGKDLDTGTERPKLDSYCSNICNLLKEQKMSSRIKFMLQDVVALRKNNWVPRRKDEGPKTIQQLHQEVKQAEEREQLQLKKAIPGKFNQDSRRNCEGDRKQRYHRGSSSTFRSPEKYEYRSMRNTWRPKEREPVVYLDEQKINRGTQIKVNKITVEHKTTPKGGSSKPLSELFAKEEAPVNGGMVDCNEEEVYQALKRLLQNNSVNDQLEEWIQNTLNNRQRSSDGFVRALMRAVCQSVIVDCKCSIMPGYQHVDSLGEYLVELQEQTVLFLNPQQTDTIISLWQNLHDYDKQQTPTMTTNIYQAGQVPSIRSPQRGGEGNGRTAGATEKVIRTFRGILNKLTPEMFESLMKQVDELNIDTEETLNAVVELIVNKALSEQSYSATYAKMCHHLKGVNSAFFVRTIG